MSPTYSGKLFLLGATGYVGSQFLVQLREQLPNIHVVAIARNATEERRAAILQLNPNTTIVEGSLDNDAIIREQAFKVDIVVNAANGQHEPSTRAALAGLEEASKQRPGNPPIYIHTSGYAQLANEADGEAITDYATATKYIDTSYSPDDVPQDNLMVVLNKEIIAAGERKENPVKTMIIFPSWIYGIGDGIQKITLALRMWLSFAKAEGHAVTLGRGFNQTSTIHVRDVATSMIAMLKDALDGTASTGAQGLYFAGSEFETSPTLKEAQDEIGNALCELGLVTQPGSHPASPMLAQAIPPPIFRVFSGNSYAVPERLKQLGVEFTETKKLSLLQSLKDEVGLAVNEGAWAHPMGM
ncbi:hypothetical protein AX16_000021 [Volvariella volvacea WC 439]|nr:hypothetical protein AX16_000021 [Volvariella volvacea WC 439]